MEKIQPKNWEKRKKNSKSVLGYSKTLKKVKWTTKPLGEGGLNLSSPTTKKTSFFMCVFPNQGGLIIYRIYCKSRLFCLDRNVLHKILIRCL